MNLDKALPRPLRCGTRAALLASSLITGIVLVACSPQADPGDRGDRGDPAASEPHAALGNKHFLLNRDRASIRVDGRSGVDFTNLRGELPQITEVRCQDRTRRALVQLPGSEVAFPAALPYSGQLEFGIGFRASAPQGPRFQLSVLARGASGDEVLWRETLQAPTSEAERQWRTERVDVSQLGPGDLVLRVAVEAGAEPTPALPVWGDLILRGSGLLPNRDLPAAPKAPGEPTRPNVVVFLVDTLRADRIGTYGYSQPTTPRLDAIAQRGLVFEQALAASSWTKASIASLFTSRLPSQHGAEDYPHRLRDSETTIAQLFQRAGYATGAVGANLWIFYPHFHFGGGFGDFLQTFEAQGLGGPAADAVVDEAIDWLEQHYGDPFFLYVHVMDPHSPYRPPGGPDAFLDTPYVGSISGETSGPNAFSDREPGQLSAEDQRYLDALYDAEIAYADGQMGRLVDRLQSLGVWDNTLFVFLSDHGEEFGEHGGWEHSTSLFEEQIHVPLIVVPPASAQLDPARIQAPVSLLDVAPTMLALTGVPAGASAFAERGPGLLRGRQGPPQPPVVSELHLQDKRVVAARLGELKLIAFEEPRGVRELFDLGKDAGERNGVPTLGLETRTAATVAELEASIESVLARGGEDGVYLELWGGGEVCGVRGEVRSDQALRDVNPQQTEYRIEGEQFTGDSAYFSDAEKRVIAFELRVGGEDTRDFVSWNAPAGARLTLETAFAGTRPEIMLGVHATEPQTLPIEIVVADSVLHTDALPPPPTDRGPLLRLFVVKREEAILDAEQLERVRALGYGGDE